MKKITREEAIDLFHQQWTDMQKELGDCPSWVERAVYKRKWCEAHNFVNCNSCFLCEWAVQNNNVGCDKCPIDWDYVCCVGGKVDYRYASISEILALPERKVKRKKNKR